MKSFPQVRIHIWTWLYRPVTTPSEVWTSSVTSLSMPTLPCPQDRYQIMKATCWPISASRMAKKSHPGQVANWLQGQASCGMRTLLGPWVELIPPNRCSCLRTWRHHLDSPVSWLAPLTWERCSFHPHSTWVRSSNQFQDSSHHFWFAMKTSTLLKSQMPRWPSIKRCAVDSQKHWLLETPPDQPARPRYSPRHALPSSTSTLCERCHSWELATTTTYESVLRVTPLLVTTNKSIDR